MKKFLCLFLLCLLMSMGVFWTLRGKEPAHHLNQNHHTIILPIHTLEKQSFTYTKSFIGTVEAIQSVAIVPYSAGFLKEVCVQPGAEVQKGKTLFLLDERIPLANLNQAKEAVSQAHAVKYNAENYYQRIKKTGNKAVSPTELERAKATFEEANASYQKALAAQKRAQTLYDYTIIQAPISGWLGDVTATIGQYLSPEGQALATIIGFSPIRLTFSVPMGSCGYNFSADQTTLQVVLADGTELEFKDFKLIRDNQADKSTDSLSFFVDVPNEKKLLIPGAYVEVRILSQKIGLLADKNWITLTPDGAEAFILKAGMVEKQKIKIGAPIGHQYWIKSGLNEGDSIITVPVSSFQIGRPAQGVAR